MKVDRNVMRDGAQKMLTPDQTRVRRLDNEIRRLKLENERLENKLAGVRVSFAALLREMAKHASFGTRVQISNMVRELESDA